MSYSPKVIRDVAVASGGSEASVLFVHDTDPTLTFQQSFLYATQAELDAKVQARIAQTAKVPIAFGTPISTTPVTKVPTLPSAADTARALWMAQREQVRACQRGLAEQIPGYDQARLDQAISDRDKLYDASFEDMV